MVWFCDIMNSSKTDSAKFEFNLAKNNGIQIICGKYKFKMRN